MSIVLQVQGKSISLEAGRGKSAYQSYLDTTDDDPVLSEEAWAAARAGGGYVAEVEAAEAVVSPGDTDRFGWIKDVGDVVTLFVMTGTALKAWLKSYFDTVFATTAQGSAAEAAKTKTDLLTVTAATNLDAIRQRVDDLDAAVILKGSWDASAGTFPGGGTAQAGWSYIVSVAGTVGGVAFAIGDRAIAITDNASTTVFASNWFKADYTDQVLSVNGQTGAVSLTAAGIGAVATTGNATVAGIKTFSSSPIVPAPTTDMQAATKKYVDDNSGGGGSAISNPNVAYARSDGNNTTAEIGNPAKPFATAQAAANAIAAASAGSYTMRLGAGSFGGITYTAQIADRLRSILGEGPGVSLLGGITASGAIGVAGTGDDATGGSGANGIDINLIGDGTVNLGDIVANGGAGGAGAVSTDGESGGNGGGGGSAGALSLEGFHLVNITANGGEGASGANGNTSQGNGGDGGSVSSISLKRCTFNNLSQGAGTGGSGANTAGNNGSGAAPMLVSWCDYTDINNPSDQAANPAAYIVHSIYRGTPGSAQTLDAVLVS